MKFLPTTELLSAARHSIFHLEVRDSYGVESEDEPLQCFLRGEQFDLRAWFQDWYDFVQDRVAHGVSVSRIRVVTTPHSDYQRWLLELTALNTEAGEDIRYLPRHLAGQVPPDDWWLVDDETVVFNLSDCEGRAVGGSAVTTDPAIAAYCRGIRDRLWPLTTPFDEYCRVTTRQ
ncbi:DUF6879 family protein [Nocardia sp. NPDC003693]